MFPRKSTKQGLTITTWTCYMPPRFSRLSWLPRRLGFQIPCFETTRQTGTMQAPGLAVLRGQRSHDLLSGYRPHSANELASLSPQQFFRLELIVEQAPSRTMASIYHLRNGPCPVVCSGDDCHYAAARQPALLLRR